MRQNNDAQRSRYRMRNGKHSVELKLRTPHQLFDERDPAPFRERDLDDDAAKYILGSFRDLKGQGEVKLSLFLESLGDFKKRPADIATAIHEFFGFEADTKRRELRETFRLGTISLLIGITFIATSTLLAENLTQFLGDTAFAKVSKEGLTVMGWVAMWKPTSIFLYEWWPIRDALKDHLALSEIEVEVLTNDATQDQRQQGTGPISADAKPLRYRIGVLTREPANVR